MKISNTFYLILSFSLSLVAIMLIYGLHCIKEATGFVGSSNICTKWAGGNMLWLGLLLELIALGIFWLFIIGEKYEGITTRQEHNAPVHGVQQ